MKRMLFCGLSCALVASVVAASDGSSLRPPVAEVVLARSVQLGSPTVIDLPPPLPSPATPTLSPVPDPLYMPSLQQPSPSLQRSGPLNQQPVDRYTTQYQGGIPFQGSVSPGYPATTVSAQPVALFADVRYHAVRNIAPCAVPTIIQVPDPCSKSSCGKCCVNVEICAPPCDPKLVKVTRDGDRVRFDYGKYAVVAKTVGSHIVVHYHD